MMKVVMKVLGGVGILKVIEHIRDNQNTTGVN